MSALPKDSKATAEDSHYPADLIRLIKAEGDAEIEKLGRLVGLKLDSGDENSQVENHEQRIGSEVRGMESEFDEKLI